MEWVKYFYGISRKSHRGRKIIVETSIVTVQNMANQQDADKVLQAIEEVWGVSKAEINLSKSQAVFTYDERMASQQDFEQAIKDLGFDITH